MITRTPGDLIGAQTSFVEELRQKIKEKGWYVHRNVENTIRVCLHEPSYTIMLSLVRY